MKKMLCFAVLVLLSLVSCNQNKKAGFGENGIEISSNLSSRDTTRDVSTPTEIKATLTKIQTATATVSPTLTSLPRMPTEDVEVLFREYLNSIESCELPCVWGITPGYTSIDDLQNNIFVFGSVEQWSDRFESTGYYLSIPVNTNTSEYGYIGIQIFLIDDTVVEVVAPFRYLFANTEPLWVDTIKGFGAPDEIWLSGASGPSPEEPVDFVLGLYYGELGIFLEFYGTTPKIERDGIRICPSSSEFSTSGISVQTWLSGESRIPRKGEDVLENESKRLREYETEMTVSQFYDNYILSQASSCFEIYPPGD